MSGPLFWNLSLAYSQHPIWETPPQHTTQRFKKPVCCLQNSKDKRLCASWAVSRPETEQQPFRIHSEVPCSVTWCQAGLASHSCSLLTHQWEELTQGQLLGLFPKMHQWAVGVREEREMDLHMHSLLTRLYRLTEYCPGQRMTGRWPFFYLREIWGLDSLTVLQQSSSASPSMSVPMGNEKQGCWPSPASGQGCLSSSLGPAALPPNYLFPSDSLTSSRPGHVPSSFFLDHCPQDSLSQAYWDPTAASSWPLPFAPLLPPCQFPFATVLHQTPIPSL